MPRLDVPMQTVCWTIAGEHANLRVDAYLATRLPWRSRHSLALLLGDGAARVNGRTIKKAYRLAAGDQVELDLPAADVQHEALAAIALPILFEDDELVVVNKPANLAVHPASTCPHIHALARLRLRYAQEHPDPTADPAVIHRLDRGTSGVVAFCRRRELVAFYTLQFEQRTVRKQYVALVHGRPPDRGVIEHPLRVLDGKPVVVAADGKPSHTEFSVLARHPATSMVRVDLHTGRKHQIRVHLAAEGFPLVYDDLYGLVERRGAWPPGARTMLHAARLELRHRTRGTMVIEAPLPTDMQDTWTMLAKHSP